jgi:hypothetical protein
VLEIRPEIATPYAEAVEQLRPDVLIEQRKRAVDDLIAAARKQHRVELAADLRQTLAELEL